MCVDCLMTLSLSLSLSLLTHTYKVPNVCFLPHHLACLFTVGRSTALVVDIGFNESSVIPVSIIIVILNMIVHLSCKIIKQYSILVVYIIVCILYRYLKEYLL